MQLEHQFPGGPQLKLDFFLCALHLRSSPTAGLGWGGRGRAAVPGGSPWLGGGHGALLPSLQQMVAHCRLCQARPQPCPCPQPGIPPPLHRAQALLDAAPLQRPPAQPEGPPPASLTLAHPHAPHPAAQGRQLWSPRWGLVVPPQPAATGSCVVPAPRRRQEGKGPHPALLCAVLPGGPELALEALENCFLLACKHLFSAHFWLWSGTSLCAQ